MKRVYIKPSNRLEPRGGIEPPSHPVCLACGCYACCGAPCIRADT